VAQGANAAFSVSATSRRTALPVTIIGNAASKPSNVLDYDLTIGADSSLPIPRVTLFKPRSQGAPAVFKVAAVPGVNYVIQVSDDLSEWKSVWTIPSAEGAEGAEYEFTDAASANLSMRFYRVVVDPNGGRVR